MYTHTPNLGVYVYTYTRVCVPTPNFGIFPQPPQSVGKIAPLVNRLTNNINYHVGRAMQSEFNQQSGGDPLGFHQVPSYKHWNMAPHP